jgi:hypothetical protein
VQAAAVLSQCRLKGSWAPGSAATLACHPCSSLQLCVLCCTGILSGSNTPPQYYTLYIFPQVNSYPPNSKPRLNQFGMAGCHLCNNDACRSGA